MSSILLNMEWRILRLTHGRGSGYTTSTFDVKPSLRNRISSPAGFIILVQSTVIAFLSFWIYQEYLNNPYLQAYVNDYLQTSGWAIAILGVMAAVGGVTLLFLRNKTVEKEIGAVSPEAEVPGPVATGAAEVSPKLDTMFHPVVAALKAELAGRPVPYGGAPVSSGEESKTEGVARPSTSLNAIVASQKAELAEASAPVGVAPVPRMEEGTGSAGVQPPVVAGPTTPRDLSTVITGVVQVPKKREAETSAGEKAPSQ